MKKILHRMVMVFMCLLGTTLRPVCAQDTVVNGKTLPPVTITGVIRNISEIKEYISNETYLQIVQATDGKLNMHAVNGELIFKSSLPQIPFPEDGIFVFKKVRNLKLGESYIIVSQMIENSMNRAIWLIMEGKPLKLDFPLDYKYAPDTKEIKIDLTKNDVKFSP
ncbi:MAG: hypothetical protein R6V76_10225 [Desulfobacterales bacterium]